jgi:ABC-2 type transport system permease protein
MKYKWYVVMSMPQFFISLVSIAEGAGLFASEYDDRSAYILYTRPLTRLNIFISKFLGGYALITSLTLLYAALSIGVSIVFFGDIEGIWVAPYVALAMVFAQLIIYSITYMFSQLTRRTILAMIIGIAIILISPIVESMLLTLDFLSGWLGYIIKIFPTWAMGLPEFVASELLPDFISLGGAGDIPSAIIVIVGYFLLTSSITVYSLMKRDLVTD